MIEPFVKAYKLSDRDIDALTYAVVVLILLIVGRAAQLLYGSQYQEFWQLLPQAVPLLSVLVVVRVANRLLANGSILREAERQLEIVRTTHHLIAIAKDLKARVGYVKAMLTEGGRPPFALIQIAKSIEERYETLLERDSYKYLPGPCVDLITGMSGSIFGIVSLAEGVRQVVSENSGLALVPMPASNEGQPPLPFDTLMEEIEQLLGQLFELRGSIEAAKEV